MEDAFDWDVIVVGGGVAGLTAGIFTSRHGLSTLVLSAGSPLLRRNAHLENFPGFPAGVNSRLLLDMMEDQAIRAGCVLEAGTVTEVQEGEHGFTVHTAAGEEFRTPSVIAATKNEVGYLGEIDGVRLIDRGKLFVATDEGGRTGVDGLYAAGRIAEKPHQAIVAAGHGAEVAVALLEDLERPFYHDWVAPERYFTGRGREVPPGCEEIHEDERQRRERESLAVMREYFEEPHPDRPEQHPSVRE